MSNFPLVLGRAELFEAARGFFRELSYDDSTLCRELGIADMGAMGHARWERLDRPSVSPALRLCISVFLRGQTAPEADLRRIWGESAFEALIGLGLLWTSKRKPGEMVTPVWVYPVDGYVIASDRRENLDGGPLEVQDDVVFPAIYGGTLRFLKLMPDARGGDALDLCGGTGIGAFRLKRSARYAATSDLTERSAQFAEFNARLNGLDVASLCGDLYLPTDGRVFDLVTAHPPFVPASGQVMVYRDGGDTGEQVTRGVVAGLSKQLKPGGRCMILCVGRDADDGPLEQRVRAWLGEEQDEFDVLFGLEKTLDVDEVVETIRRRQEGVSDDEARRVHDRLMKAGTRRFVYGVLFIERFAQAHAMKPLRVSITPEAVVADFERLFESRRRRREPDFAKRLERAKPKLVDGLSLTATHVARGGDLQPSEFVFRREGPVSASLRLDGWVIPLIARMNGAVSVAEVFSDARTQSEMPAGFPFEVFLELVASLIDRDFLEARFGDVQQESGRDLEFRVPESG